MISKLVLFLILIFHEFALIVNLKLNRPLSFDSGIWIFFYWLYQDRFLVLSNRKIIILHDLYLIIRQRFLCFFCFLVAKGLFLCKGTNENVVNGKLKYKDYKNFLFNRSFMRHEINRIQIIWDRIELIKFLCLLTMIKDIFLKMNIKFYHIFINLLVNHIKIILSNVVKIVKTAILLTSFFLAIIFFCSVKQWKIILKKQNTRKPKQKKTKKTPSQ